MHLTTETKQSFVLKLTIIALALLVAKPFYAEILLALVIYAGTNGLNNHIRKDTKGPLTAAALTLCLVIAVILLPLLIAYWSLSAELGRVIGALQSINQNGMPAPPWLEQLPLMASQAVELWNTTLAVPGGLAKIISADISALAQLSVKGTAGLLANFGQYALHLFFAGLTLFFLYFQGDKFFRSIRKVILAGFDKQILKIVRLGAKSVKATIKGMVLIAIGEGFILGTAYYFAGAPNPALLGLLTAFAAVIPGGAPTSVVVVSVYLMASGNGFAAVSLLSWGLLQLFLVDKFIRPYLVGHETKTPFIFVIFGLIGGLSLAGLPGLFIGPAVMTMGLCAWATLLNKKQVI